MIRVEVKNYCQSCLDFEADVEKPTSFYSNGEVVAYIGDTVVRCENRNRCEAIKKHMEKGQKEVGCKYCQYTHGCEVGKPFEITSCANGDLGVRATYLNGGIILFRDHNIASGFFEIDFCPKCGRKIKGGEL